MNHPTGMIGKVLERFHAFACFRMAKRKCDAVNGFGGKDYDFPRGKKVGGAGDAPHRSPG